jgi:hypothetical protein
MIEHDTWQQLAAAEVSAREPQAAELERIAQPGLRRPALIDGSKIAWAEHMVTQNLGFRPRQYQQCIPLFPGHGNSRRHSISFQKLFALRGHIETGL